MIAIAMVMVLLGATPGIAKELTSKEVKEKMTKIQSHLSETRQDTKMWKDVTDTSFDRRAVPPRQKVTENDEPMVTINCKFVWDEESGLRPERFILNSKDGDYLSFNRVSYGASEIAIEVPQYMECYVVALFEGYMSQTLVAKTIKTDGDLELILDASEADQTITFKPLLPNGDEMVADTKAFDENYNVITVEEGNIAKASYGLDVQFINGTDILYNIGEYQRWKYDDVIVDMFDYVYYNTNDNDILIFSNTILGINKADGGLGIMLISDGTKTQEISNSPEDFINIDNNYSGCLWEIPTTNEFIEELNPSLNCGIGVSTNLINSESCAEIFQY